MNDRLEEMNRLANQCNCGNKHNLIQIEEIVIAKDALDQLVTFLQKKAFQHVVLVVDEQTYKAAGEKLSNLLHTAGFQHTVCKVDPDENGDVMADEKVIVQALLGTPREADVLLAVGAGTLHDVTRICSEKTKTPFISIPTAPSVDGFTSLGAPLIVRGFKQTFQTQAPLAVFADIEILMNAPANMIAAGFGDMMAKFTSLADWKFGEMMADEPYCPLVESLTKEALETCITNRDHIARKNEAGVTALIDALIVSGLAMLIFGQSHPASGGEHHLSHYWEMEFLRERRPQILHGAKVGVATSLLARLYKEEMQTILLDRSQVKDPFLRKRIKDHQHEIQAIINNIPETAYFEKVMEKVGGKSSTFELGIHDSLVTDSMLEAHKLRERFTMLHFLNEELMYN
ncbi:sn-glycerol-1-phosphate dehydrogenase [Bacillus sp. FJAT-50079]|uniref:sn-glycerol-1-phosphate dehydrogenase n=1 Tax=Bacillus sp. FJAT-50079 TaxID=2833577 RepID=UPI001BCA10DF|nr:sn-glycerol-1-phosphate dehydrogenase [Bacillus sp. FJAT-50079]MBS4208270.1 sn-glycerol-1-phosphate dehydrogenase [Bacillus sp. FJAT-50079]